MTKQNIYIFQQSLTDLKATVKEKFSSPKLRVFADFFNLMCNFKLLFVNITKTKQKKTCKKFIYILNEIHINSEGRMVCTTLCSEENKKNFDFKKEIGAQV